jgi:hypothetical protein
MLNSIYKHEEIKNPKLATAGIAVGTVALDILWGKLGNTNRRTYPAFHTTNRTNNDSTLGVLPGCQTSAELFFKALKHQTPNAQLVVTDYPEHTFGIEQICEEFGNQLIKARAERPSIYCQSMGGIVVRHFLHYAYQSGVAEKLGGINSIVLDSSPFDYEDVRDGSKHLATAASLFRASHTFDFLKRQIYRPIAGQMSAGAHLDTIRAETAFMRQTHPDGPLPDIMEKVFYLHGSYDHVVNTDTAVPRYEAITPANKFHEVLHADRKHGDHTADTSQFDFVLAYAGISAPVLSAAA